MLHMVDNDDVNFGDSRVSESLWSRMTPEPNTGCWLWLGYVDAGGHGVVTLNRKRVRVHRHVYSIANPDAQAGDRLLESKCAKGCCNPLHYDLESGSAHERVLRRQSSRRYLERHGAAGRAKLRGQHLKRFGITLVDEQRMFEQQGGACAICRVQFEKSKARHVDHDHKTGRVRGLLCVRCNLGLGFFKDDPDRMSAAIEYLRYE
jgi:hypothetical protein